MLLQHWLVLRAPTDSPSTATSLEPTSAATSAVSSAAASMTSEQWIANLLQGSVGAALSLLGLFGVFLLTRKHEKDLQIQAFERENEKAREQRTVDSVASLLQACHSVQVTKEAKSVNPMLTELVLFSIREVVDHPETAAWAEAQAVEASRYMRDRDLPDVVQKQSSLIVADLRKWVRKGCPAELLKADDVKKQWGNTETSLQFRLTSSNGSSSASVSEAR